jgi:hypothetical protein
MNIHFPRNMIDFTQRFSTEDACETYLRNLHWSKGFIYKTYQEIIGN